MINFSKDFNSFKPFFLNRLIQKKNLSNLVKSIREQNLLQFHPLIITDENEILDGQHRFEAAKSLDLEFYYIKLPKMSLEQLVSVLINFNFNMSKWGAFQFAQLYEKLNKPEYMKFKTFREKFNLEMNFALPLCAPRGKRRAINESFRKGYFEFENELEIYNLVENCLEFLDKCKEMRMIRSKSAYMNTTFFDAYLKMMRQDDFSQSKIMNQLDKYKICLTPVGTMTQYYDYLAKLLNERRGLKEDKDSKKVA